MNKKLASAKKFVDDRKNALLAGTTAAALAAVGIIAIQQFGIRQHDDFLKEHDLYDEFYNPED